MRCAATFLIWIAMAMAGPAPQEALLHSSYVLGPDDQLIIRALDAWRFPRNRSGSI